MRSVQQRLKFLAFCSVVALAGCSSDDSSNAGCQPLDPAEFPCVDPSQCLSVTATWCFPGASACTNMDADLTLSHPLAFTIDASFTPVANINGCIHDGDETAPGITGPFDENITCSPYVHAAPPDRIDAGTYTASVFTAFSALHAGTPVRIDTNVDGLTACQVVAIESVPSTVNIVYP